MKTVLSYYGVHYFLIPANTSLATKVTLPGTGGFEIEDVLECTIGGISKDVQNYKTLGGGGWDYKVALGQSLEAGSISLLRTGEGDAYVGTAGTSTYTKLRNWVNNATENGGANAPMILIEIVPRSASVYEGTAYNVLPSSFEPAARNTSNGQEYSVNIEPFDAPVFLDVTVETGGIFGVKKHSTT